MLGCTTGDEHGLGFETRGTQSTSSPETDQFSLNREAVYSADGELVDLSSDHLALPTVNYPQSAHPKHSVPHDFYRASMLTSIWGERLTDQAAPHSTGTLIGAAIDRKLVASPKAGKSSHCRGEMGPSAIRNRDEKVLPVTANDVIDAIWWRGG
jgi:hypothetical protein